MSQQLLQRLCDKGRQMGFNVSTGETELTWFFRENEPVISFHIDEFDGSKIFAKTLDLYWSSADYVNKPWRHFCILTDGAFNPEHRNMLNALSAQYGVHFFENPSPETLENFLDERISRLTTLLSRYTKDGTVTTLRETVKNWAKNKPRIVQNYIVNAVYDVHSLNVFHDENNELRPSRKTPPLTIETGEGVSLESIMPRLTDARDGSCLFSTEHRNLPFILKFKLEDESAGLTLGFEPDKGNITQAIAFEEFLESFNNDGSFNLLDPSSGACVVTFRV
ncbi:MAG: hypothetical protein NWE89_14065 [Candidatus Bathyarchaeota archaeon]|nr:hypothetical protein [Candidatus Bathyarchaeota archaeon]